MEYPHWDSRWKLAPTVLHILSSSPPTLHIIICYLTSVTSTFHSAVLVCQFVYSFILIILSVRSVRLSFSVLYLRHVTGNEITKLEPHVKNVPRSLPPTPPPTPTHTHLREQVLYFYLRQGRQREEIKCTYQLFGYCSTRALLRESRVEYKGIILMGLE